MKGLNNKMGLGECCMKVLVRNFHESVILREKEVLLTDGSP